MNEKKQMMIQVGMKLFAEKGFHATSIQEIAEQSGVSKGAFYLHFKSKKDFTVAVYKHYYETMKERLREVEQRTFSNQREKFAKEIEVFFEEFLKQKEFIIMHFRENFSLHKEVEELVFKMRSDSHAWYERNLLAIYGDGVKPFIVDGTTMIEGFIDSYMKVMLFEGVTINLAELSRFIVRRADDVILGMLQTEKHPQLTKAMLKPFYQMSNKSDIKESVNTILVEMMESLSYLKLDEDRIQDLHTTIDVLLKEIKKADPQKVIFQGMLSNLLDVKEFEEGRKKIEAILQLKSSK